MTIEQGLVREWMSAGRQGCPPQPTIPSLQVRRLRAKLILEEAVETIHALGFKIGQMDLFVEGTDMDLIPDGEPSLTEIADGCEDLKVVTEGTLIACGMVATISEHDPLFDEVMRSNFSKFTLQPDGTRTVQMDADGKIQKPKTFTPPDLAPIINRMFYIK